MVTLRLLGGVSLDGENGPVTGRTAQRRRIALLALLATARSQSLSRDKIVGYLWPESNEEKARRLLSESLYVIRKALGEDSVLAHGEDLRLNGEVVWTDAPAFMEALDGGDLVGAVELYRGPFLDGFHLKDAPEFGHWVDGERDHLERRFAEALRRLASEAEREGDPRGAVVWWRRLAELDRYDAQVAVAYMTALEGAGQRAAALQHARIHAALLREEFDAEPDPEVERLAERLRDAPLPSAEPSHSDEPQDSAAEGHPASPDAAAPQPDHPVGEEPIDTPQEKDASPPSSSSGRRWAVGVAGIGILALILAVLNWNGGGGPLPQAPPSEGQIVVAVLPFTIQGEVGRTLQEGGLPTLVGIGLDEVDGITSVDQDALWHSLGRPGTDDPLSQEYVLQAARQFEVDYTVRGSIVAVGDGRLRVSATLNSMGSASREAPVVSVDGSSEDLRPLADTLVFRLLAGIQESTGEHLSGIAAQTSQSLTAVNAWLEGREEFRATRFGRALDAFERAVEEDETFALAHYRRSIAALMDLKFDEARFSAERAVRHSNRLTGRYRRLLVAWNALLEGDADQAERQYLEYLGDYPDDVEAHFGLGEVQVFYNPVRGLSPAASRPSFEAVIGLNPGYGQARFHLLELATSRRDRPAFDELFRGIAEESDQALAWAAVRAFWGGRAAEREAIERRIRTAAPQAAGLAVARVAAHLQDYPAAERLAGILAGPGRDADTQAAAHVMMAMMRFAQGKWDGGMEALRTAREFDPAWATELEALYTGYPLRILPSGDAVAARDVLAAWDAGQAGPSTNFVLFAHNGFHESLRFYLLGLTSLWAGEPEEAIRYAGELEKVHRDPANQATDLAWGQSLRAQAAGLAGRTDEAIRWLEGVRSQVPLERIAISPFFSRAYDRYALGQLLVTAGRPEDALRWFRSLTEGYEVGLVAPAHLQMARILDEMGDTAEAAQHYSRFLELWQDPDEEFQAVLEEARARLGSLR